MDRRNFLAFIPALGAAPFLGKEITKTESGILIVDPQPQAIAAPTTNRDFCRDVEVRLYLGGQHVGNARMNSFDIWRDPVRDLYGNINHDLWRQVAPDMEMTCTVINPQGMFDKIYGSAC